MKIDKSDAAWAVLLTVIVFGGIVAWGFEIVLLFILAAVPFFCIQLLCCLTKRWWTRILPIVPITALSAIALRYLICDGGGDYLAPLVFALANAPAVGAALAWGMWWFSDHRKRN